MPKETLVKKGEKCAPSVQLSELEETYKHERRDKSRSRLQAAVLKKCGRILLH